ncbi:MAG: hypothetical protein A3B99_04650 [Candidatus Yanofskybacteria bacterium RIFCSPHIGHO2_02_FULL_44_12b]|uniref:Probable potassium transport system protein Kup n=2 Tax=Candidatus Yanofskyibacteriota TaxID=1752733 RepID=A0A1F8GM61_9BACT|nr:MAG: putative potassium transport system protein kup [Candidatus Yanofskybacteria bacterium GW2011_GWA2_44_9]OGN04356.1 MAG: hypothetical protein A2659_03450 [Candidatus Yanofskybacteria bacterium RIFCSPHIGHO2_01_FULL_44_24]OGN14465.1 MAG: hypothetical protein A3B99_04650 [Candidatus Yanofskybacteria bacterium RIFCSPHIGHO2_02_FULL_44_12b]OGN25746.1 MAG: hypothetical protein A2925_00990 [Candidatus Yanofskybacteria bacterium RIFCSPLOWO2_01_FULL_44_22]
MLKRLSNMALPFLSLGIVFGDIGTSPLYALREIFFGHYQVATNTSNVFGALSLFFWSLFLIVAFKYIFIILRADNEGEGGIFALLGLIRMEQGVIPRKIFAGVTLLVLFGAALLYGDGMITPAISVVSAIEGLGIAMPGLSNMVVPITIAILFFLFKMQKRGTSRIGVLFSPVMTLWFVTLAVLAMPQLFKHPEVFQALNPTYGIRFLLSHGLSSLWILGSVFLCVTGAEALYADLGHFGRKAITNAWFFFVYPSLLLNYFGQGAMLLGSSPIPGGNLFYALSPDWALFPMIILATVATVIASQALISGAYSLTHQAMALGVFPRVKTIHTNPDIRGQIYMPFINWALFLGCVILIVFFKSSSNLAAAYGVAVAGTMVITTLAFFVVANYRWKWPLKALIPICTIFLFFDLTFFGSSLLKFLQGGYIPILVALVLLSVMWAWQWGRKAVGTAHRAYGDTRQMSWLIDLKRRLEESKGIMNDRARWLVESDRVVVFMSSHPVSAPEDGMPAALRVYLKRNGVVPKHMIVLSILQGKAPFSIGERYTITNFGFNIIAVQVKFGFMENPNVKDVLWELKRRGVLYGEIHRCSIEIGEEDIVIHRGVPIFNDILARMYRILSRFSTPAHRYFGLIDVSGVDKTIVPIVIDKEGARVDIPEFPLSEKDEKDNIDPDTLRPSETKFHKIT